MTIDNKTVTVYDNASFSGQDIRIEKTASGFQFTEGPVWHPEGYLLFSDIPANCVWQLFPDGSKKIFLENSGFSGKDRSELSDQVGSNGLAIDAKQNLLICQHGNHAIAMLDSYHVISCLVSSYENRRLNSPNDLSIKSDGSIYFTDPPYGLKNQVHHPHAFQSSGGLYRYRQGKLSLLSDDLRYPNGVCFSPDETYLYVSSSHTTEAAVWRYQLTSSGELEHPALLIQHNADGIKTDEKGNLFLATDEGVLMVSPAGKKIALLHLPETPANLAWVKPGYHELYVTARSSIYLLSGFV